MTHSRILPGLDRLDLAAMLAALPAWRREQAMAYRQQTQQRECAAAYLLLCQILREHFGITRQPKFNIGEHGKPFISEKLGVRSEEWPAGTHSTNNTATGRPLLTSHSSLLTDQNSSLHFNLSHCRLAVAVAVSDEGAVGIDIECTGRYKPALASYCMSTDEQTRIADSDNPDTLFTQLWTQKEALLKLTGEGITDDLRHVLTSPRAQSVSLDTYCTPDYVWTIATIQTK